MKSFFEYRLRILIAVVLLAIWSILFVWTIKNPDTQTTSLWLTLQWVTDFKMWLDVAGGVKLTYKIDYSKYRELYANQEQFNSMKNLAEQIVINNIDNRISKLWVSDYNAYTQELNGQDYVIVEIGWVSDINEAKNIIGKTVELEFKLENKQENTAEGRAQRKKIAQDLLSKALTNPEAFSTLSIGREWDDIYYQDLSGVSLSQLPLIYTTNKEIIKNMPLNSINPTMLEGIFSIQQSQNAKQELEDIPLMWHTIVKMLDRKTVPITWLSAQIIVSKAQELWFTTESEIRVWSISIASWEMLYDSQSSSLLYNNWWVFNDEEAWDVEVYMIPLPVLIGVSEDEAQKRQFALKQKQSELIDALNKNTLPSMSGVNLIYSGWINTSQLQTQISWVMLNTMWVLVYNQPSWVYIVKTRIAKKATDVAYWLVTVLWLPQNRQQEFKNALKEDTLYFVQHIFVRDRTSWIAAKDTQTNKILNGSFFSIAKVEQDNVGRPAVGIEFNEEWKKIFCDISTNNIGQQMAIFVWGIMTTNAVIQDKLCAGQALITSPNYTSADAKKLVDSLNDGAMPVPLILHQEEKVSPLVWEYALNWALRAGIVSMIILFIMMMYLYGLRHAYISSAVLAAYLIVTFGFIKISGYALSLSGIAAIILSIGMAIDACILIFERYKEESNTNQSHQTMVVSSVNKSRSAILDGNLSTGIIWLLLSLIGMNIFKWFWSMMVINMLLILLINVPLTTHLMLLWLRPTSSSKK